MLQPFRILSLDGGGVRGALSLAVLEELDRRMPGWLGYVDIIAGTSTGGITALALARGLRPETVTDLYARMLPKIFKDSLWDDVRDLGRIVGAEYDLKGLQSSVEDVFGTTTLSELRKAVLIPAFDLDNESKAPRERSWKPKFFNNLPGDHGDGHLTVAQVALYTAAAPTYFPSYGGYIDGGVVANNPSMAALAFAQDVRTRRLLGGGDALPSILSLGTGHACQWIAGTRHDWGAAQWARPLVSILLEGLTQIPHYQAKHILGPEYHRVDYTFPPGGGIDLDDVDAFERLLQIARTELQDATDRAADWIERVWA